ncbi:protein of unknown function [Parapedobacter composti]|uniref:DUF4292 domain-containing protein n=1 Tax=Parapedobacter composti TaxID=623281 RepID=A0A1I1IB16_9SPHI|nr:DUF4292 domain-containing protein [Parapedobacter composti]SFC31448.1 protein of unknown function [Parapedobacter composti]
MRDNILINGWLFFLVAVVALSCAPKRKAVTDKGEERRVSRAERMHILRAVGENRSQFSTFSGRAKSRIAINKNSYDVTANVRMERDKAIWISITAFMGIEAGRVLITPDSVKIINRLQSEYIRKPFDYLYEFTSRELDFAGLQDLLMGNVIASAVNNDTEVVQTATGSILSGQSGGLQYSVAIDDRYRASRISLDEQRRGQQLTAVYTGHQLWDGRPFPQQVGISIMAKGLTLKSEMQYSNVVYDKAVEMPFNIPSRYKEVQ